MTQHPSSKTTSFLDQPPSCLQFCPASPNDFVVGTYLLSEKKTTDEDGLETIQQSKTGSLQLWHLEPETDALTQKSTYPIIVAVFDLHFHPKQDNILAIATSDASVSIFRVSPESETGFTLLWTKTVHEDPSVPALFLAWLPDNWLIPSPAKANQDGFAVTFSDGRTGVFGLTGDATGLEAVEGGDVDEQITELGSFDAKQPIEVWFVAVASYLNSSAEIPAYTPYMFTGNDFGSLHTRRFADINAQSEVNDEEEFSPLPDTLISTDDKALHHTAGVTSILPLPIPLSHAAAKGEPLLLTGSYDDSLRVCHACRGGRGEVLAEVGLGGGVWRLQLLDSTTTAGPQGEEWTFLVLASCMHGGTRVVSISVGADGKANIEILAQFTEHESMNYASDVWKGKAAGSGSELRVVSSSFYDKRVCVWRVQV
ncbi:hypothetical protein BDW74DRAFT_187777 [Aspergillus multicolor]|uniref:uncharacterized protein n=1 Tax=Aspergillus multicolor TaxID=41759 RepID=UPI003CCE31A4